MGAHYTSEENILKLIGPLFLDDLYAQFHKIKIQRQRLLEFHQKLRHITFCDPACGCGNFLVISYRELRKLEMEVLRGKLRRWRCGWVDHPMNMAVSAEFGLYFARIPLKTNSNIVLERWCLWLVDVLLSLLRNTNEVSNRIEAVRKLCAASNREATRTLASQPSLFGEIRQPEAPFLLLPKVSSESRRFMPIGFLPPDVVANGSALIIKNAGLFEFGVLQSTMHMAWMRATAGRMKSDYQYSAQIVYNNFPWPDIPAALAPNKPITPAHKAQVAIEVAAQSVLDTRAQYFPAASLADLYDPLVMPVPLVKAHQLCGGKKIYATDAERVAFLFERYQQLTSLLPVAKKNSYKRIPHKALRLI